MMEFTKQELQAQNCNLRAELESLEQKVEELEDELAEKEWASFKDGPPEKDKPCIFLGKCKDHNGYEISNIQLPGGRSKEEYFEMGFTLTHFLYIPGAPKVQK